MQNADFGPLFHEAIRDACIAENSDLKFVPVEERLELLNQNETFLLNFAQSLLELYNERLMRELNLNV